MKQALFSALVGLLLHCAPANAEFIVFDDITLFNQHVGTVDNILNFRTDKTGNETFDFSSFKIRPGDSFTDLVTFSSLQSTDTANVLWGHFDGGDGGIGSLPNLLNPLRLDFEVPMTVVGFRNRGIQPGINVRYYDEDGNLIGEVVASPSSFVGVSSTIPIDYLVVQELPPQPSAGQRQQPAFITFLNLKAADEPTPVVVPLPSTFAILFSGALFLVCFRQCFRRPSAKNG